MKNGWCACACLAKWLEGVNGQKMGDENDAAAGVDECGMNVANDVNGKLCVCER